MKQLPAIPLKDSYYSLIEAEIKKLFDLLIYKPVAEAMRMPVKEITNSVPGDTALANAIRSGKVWYDNGFFYGDFNSTLSKELRAAGASFNRLQRTWALNSGALPVSIKFAIADASIAYSSMQQRILTALASVNLDEINKISTIPDTYLQTIDAMNRDFVKSIKGSIGVIPQLTDAQRGMIAAEWGQNLDLYIRDWTASNILKLRQEVQQTAFTGRRSSSLIKVIQDNYGVSQRKAKFLARQETSLLMSKFHEQRYKGVGITKYKWSTSNDARTRKDHQELNGKIFSFDSPPVMNKETGARGNPGEDFGCRCRAIPIIENT